MTRMVTDDVKVDLPSYDTILADRGKDPLWCNMRVIANALGLNSISETFEAVNRYGVELIVLEPDGVRANQPDKAIRYGVWQPELDSLVETLAEKKRKVCGYR